MTYHTLDHRNPEDDGACSSDISCLILPVLILPFNKEGSGPVLQSRFGPRKPASWDVEGIPVHRPAARAFTWSRLPADSPLPAAGDVLASVGVWILLPPCYSRLTGLCVGLCHFHGLFITRVLFNLFWRGRVTVLKFEEHYFLVIVSTIA